MRITKQELEEFKQIYFERFGIKLSDLEAMKKAINVLNGVEMILESSTHSVRGIDKQDINK